MKSLLERYQLPLLMRTLAMMGGQRRRFLLFTGLFCAVEAAWTLLGALGNRGVIQALTARQPAAFAASLAMLLTGYALWWVYAPIATYQCARAATDTMLRLRVQLAGHLMRLPMGSLDQRPAGELLSAFSSDLDCLAHLYDWSYFQVLRSFVGGVVGLAVMLAVDWRFALVVLALGLASIWVSGCFSRRLGQAGQRRQQALAHSAADFCELLRAIKSLRLMRMERAQQCKLDQSVEAERRVKLENGRITAHMQALVSLTGALSAGMLLGAGAAFVALGLSDWGSVMALISLKGITDMVFVECGQHMSGLQADLAGGARVISLLDEPEELPVPGHARFEPMEPALRVEGLEFGYAPDAPVLSGVTLTLPRRGVLALQGRSGTGKSTLIKLLLGLYAPTQGSLIFAGQGEMTLAALRAQTAYLPQEPCLVRGSVFDNIAAGLTGASPAQVERAARLAEAHEFIQALPQGYQTLLEDGGSGLSGGQRQRIALARALIKEAPILLLDEVTSALDAATERQILDTIKRLSRTCAVILITHRPDVAVWADWVYSLER